MTADSRMQRVGTGIPEADKILGGGLRPGSATLVRGSPGAGKTIFGLHFLTAAQNTETTRLYINLGEPTPYLRETAADFGLDTEQIAFLDLSPSGEQFQGDSSYDLFHAGEVETPGLVSAIRDEVEAHDPDRVVIDPITELRHLAPDERQFRTQVLGLLDFLKGEGATVLLTSQAAPSIPDDDLQFLVDTVIDLDVDCGHRTLQVPKFRGASAQQGPHTVTITDDGMHVWSTLDPTQYHRNGDREQLSSGITELDALLGGGLPTGTITFLSGPTGVGKTTTGLQFVKAAAANGKRSVIYSFEESQQTILERAAAVDIPIDEMIESDTVVLEEIAPDELTLDEFTNRIRTEVGERSAEIVMIDGVSGYERAFRNTGDEATAELVKIGRYLRNMNVTGLVTNEVHQITGEFRATEQEVSHLADNIMILRHVEHEGELQKVIGVLKMRTNDFEKTLRQFDITADGLAVGDPLSDLRGILTGTPQPHDNSE
jgi:circadian clock protein KaiC